jgi:biotin carboxyl carrier protein
MEKIFSINGEDIKVQDFVASAEKVSFTLNGKEFNYFLITKDRYEMILDRGERVRAAVGEQGAEGEPMVIANGREAVVAVSGKKRKKSGAHSGGLTSPMPGKIFKIVKDVGADVQKGETILILEAMKMEHAIRSDKDGKVRKISFRVGELVQGGMILAEVD